MKNIFGKIGVVFGLICLPLAVISNHAYKTYESRDWFMYEYFDLIVGESQDQILGIPEIRQDHFSLFRLTEMNLIIWGYIISTFCSIIGLIAVFYAESEKEYTLLSVNAFLSNGIGIFSLNHTIGGFVILILFSIIIYNRKRNNFDSLMQ